MLSRGKEPVPRPPGGRENRPPCFTAALQHVSTPAPLKTRTTIPRATWMWPLGVAVSPGCGLNQQSPVSV